MSTLRDALLGTLYVEADGTSGGGSAATLVEADAIRSRNIRFTRRGSPRYDRKDYHSAYGGGLAQGTGHQCWDVQHRTDLTCPVTPGAINTSNHEDLWRSMPLTIAEGAGVTTITPRSLFELGTSAGQVRTATIGYDETGGDRKIAYNCVSTFKIGGSVTGDERPYVDWTHVGKYTPPVAATLNAPNFALAGVSAADFRGATLTLGSLSGLQVVTDFEFDPGLSLVENWAGVGGDVYGFAVAAAFWRDQCMLSLTVPARNQTDLAVYAAELAGTATTVALRWGTATDNRVTINMPVARLATVEEAEINGARGYNLILMGEPSSGNDQFSIVMD